MKPYYFQQNEDYEEEYIGFAENYDKALDLIDSNRVHEMSVIDELTYEQYVGLRNELDEEEVKKLDEYFKGVA